MSREFYRNVDLHLHVPEGAIPKDGPSAGITMATALASALAKIPVRRDIAMTGEITLRGKVLPIGGLKEKLLAALRAGIFEVILPRANEKDIAELPENIKNSMKLHFVDSMDEVLALALESPLPGIANPESRSAGRGAAGGDRGERAGAAVTFREATKRLRLRAPPLGGAFSLGASSAGRACCSAQITHQLTRFRMAITGLCARALQRARTAKNVPPDKDKKKKKVLLCRTFKHLPFFR